VRDYEKNTRGHIWERCADGDIDIFAFDEGHHNGPVCSSCGYSFCHHCQEDPSIDCPGVPLEAEGKEKPDAKP
jgi:hypothetical protein